MTFRLLPAWLYYVLVAMLVLAMVASYVNRVPHFDDAWNAEQAYWLWRDGYVHSTFFADAWAASGQQFVFHKGFIYAQAPVAGLLGFSVYAVKTTALLFALLTLGLLWYYFRRPALPEARWLAALLFLGCGSLAEYSFVNRPETMVMACGFASFVLLLAGRPAWAGMAAGAAALSHLNGTLYLVAGALWLLWSRAGWAAVLRFGVVGALTLGLYLLDAVLAGQLPRLLHDFMHAPVNQSNFSLWAKLAIMLRYQQVFFHGGNQVPLTVLLLLVLLLAQVPRPGGGRWSPARRYLALLVGCFWVLTARPAGFYFLLFVPVMVVVVVETLLPAMAELRMRRRRVLMWLVLLYPLAGLVRSLQLCRTNLQQPPVARQNAQLAAYMPQHHSKVVVPMTFLFGQMQHYRARSLTYYALLNDARYRGRLPLLEFFRMLERDTVRYLVTDHEHNQAYHVPPTAPARIGRYQRVYQNQWHSVYARND